jgi:hypothetical protein
VGIARTQARSGALLVVSDCAYRECACAQADVLSQSPKSFASMLERDATAGSESVNVSHTPVGSAGAAGDDGERVRRVRGGTGGATETVNVVRWCVVEETCAVVVTHTLCAFVRSRCVSREDLTARAASTRAQLSDSICEFCTKKEIGFIAAWVLLSLWRMWRQSCSLL